MISGSQRRGLTVRAMRVTIDASGWSYQGLAGSQTSKGLLRQGPSPSWLSTYISLSFEQTWQLLCTGPTSLQELLKHHQSERRPLTMKRERPRLLVHMRSACFGATRDKRPTSRANRSLLIYSKSQERRMLTEGQRQSRVRFKACRRDNMILRSARRRLSRSHLEPAQSEMECG